MWLSARSCVCHPCCQNAVASVFDRAVVPRDAVHYSTVVAGFVAPVGAMLLVAWWDEMAVLAVAMVWVCLSADVKGWAA